MNKLFKHTKKFMLLAATVVMMLATTLVVLGAVPSSEAAAKYSALTILKVGNHTYDSKKAQYKYDKFGNKTIGTAKPVIYTNGYTAADEDGQKNQPQFEVDLTNTQANAQMVELNNFIKLEVSARVGYDTDTNGKIDAYTNGFFKVKSSNESVAKVTQGTEIKRDNKGNEYESQYIIITAAENTGTATIKLTEAYPANPKIPKTASVKVTVKKLVDDIGFNSEVVKTDENGELYTKIGVKGKVTLGTTPTAKASKKTVKYILDATAQKYISISSKGVITAKKTTDSLEGGYVTVRVAAQDMQYSYYNAKNKLTKVKWGANETIKVYVANPTVKSAKILNVDFAKATTEKNYKAGKALQAYKTIPMETNVSSDVHVFKLQVAAYAGTKWTGIERTDAVRFTTSNAKVATVDNNGVITANANGTATITVVPADGVALAGKEALKVTVKVTTDVDRIETASTNVEAFAGKTYTIKANVNAGVSNSKAKGLKYEIESATPAEPLAEGEVYVINAKKNQTTTDFKEYVKAITGTKNEAAGKITSKVEGEVTVKISLKDAAIAAAHPDVKEYVTINFVDPIKSITATVPVHQDSLTTPVKQAAKTTLYVDRNSSEDGENVTATVNDTCVISTTVTKQFTGLTDLEQVEATSSNVNVVRVVDKVEGGFEVQAVGKGTAKITIAATDGSKVKKTVEIKVVQKVNEINVANAANGEIYLAPDKKGLIKTTFKATTNANASNTKVGYAFIPNEELSQTAPSVYGKLVNKTSSISLTKADSTVLFPEGGNAEPVLLGTLKVTAKDGFSFKNYIAPAVNHIPVATEVQVYALKQVEYMNAEMLSEIVSNMVYTLAEGEEGITLYRGEKLNLAAAFEVPATITDRTVTWSVGETSKDTDKNYISIKNGVLTANKTTLIGDNVTVNVTMNALDEASGKIVKISEAVEVRVIPSQADFDGELNTQITTLLKENDYSWMGAKPKFDTKKKTLTLTISDITVGKETADAEMKEKLIAVMDVFRSATDVAIANTATEYKVISIYDAEADKEWTLQVAGSGVILFENNVEIGRYAGLTESNEALSELVSLIVADTEDIVEWANRKLVVSLYADNTSVIPGTESAEQYNTKDYTTEYTIAITVSEKDLEAFIDSKIVKAVNAFVAKNAGREDISAIESIRYNADKNTTVVEIWNGSTFMNDALAVVRADLEAALEDIFKNAVSSKIEIADTENERVVAYSIEEVYEKLIEKLGPNPAMKDLEGIVLYATVDFDYAGTGYTKSYEVAFRRTVVSIDAEVDTRINTFVNGLEANPYATIEYSDVDNLAMVTVTDYGVTLAKAATGVIGKVQGFVNTLTEDSHVAAVTINGEPVGDEEGAGVGEITAEDILLILKEEWYEEGGVTTRLLSELVGTVATVEVRYDQGQVLYYIVKFQADYDLTNANITAAVKAEIDAINSDEITEDSIILEASLESENTVLVTLNEATVKETVDTLEGSGLYAMIEAVLTEAGANCGKSITLTAGKKTVALDVSDADMMSVGEIVNALAIKTVGNLSKTTINITVGLDDGRSIDYVIKFVKAKYDATKVDPEEGTESDEVVHSESNEADVTDVTSSTEVETESVMEIDLEANSEETDLEETTLTETIEVVEEVVCDEE